MAITGVSNQRQGTHAFQSERRKRTRIRIHWPVLLFSSELPEVITTTTQDLSSHGFYCLTAVPLVPGKVLECTLKVPFHDPSGKHWERNLECKVRVIRVEKEGGAESVYGVACHIDDYHFADLVMSQSYYGSPHLPTSKAIREAQNLALGAAAHAGGIPEREERG